MSVQRAGDRGPLSDTPLPDAHDDFEFQHVEFTGRVTNPQSNLGTNGFTDDMLHPNHDVEPAGGLERNEMAELRYLVINAVQPPVPDQPTGVQANIRGAQALYLTDDVEGFPQGIQNGNVANTSEDTEVEGETFQVSRLRERDDPDILWFVDLNANTQFVDTASGTGAGQTFGLSNAYPYVIDYRRMFGQGPIVDQRDEILYGYAYNLTGYNSDGNLVQWVDASFIWDVFEVEDEVRR